jgi:hypothetical protein
MTVNLADTGTAAIKFAESKPVMAVTAAVAWQKAATSAVAEPENS